MQMKLVGRTGLARILMVSEATSRNIEAAGEIAPEGIVDGRALFSADKAEALRLKREQLRVARRGRNMTAKRADSPAAA